MRSRAKLIGGALGLLLVLSACGSDSDSDADADASSESAPATEAPASSEATEPASESEGGGGTIAFSHPARAGDFYAALKEGAQQAADERGYELVESFSDSSIESQISELNTWLAQGEIDGITIHSLDVKAMAPLPTSSQFGSCAS